MENTIQLSNEEILTLAPTILHRLSALKSEPSSEERDAEMHVLAGIARKLKPYVEQSIQNIKDKHN